MSDVATSGTVDTIFKAGQVNSQGLSAIGAAIGDTLKGQQDSYKFQSGILQNMIASTLDVRKTEIDEWYKTENLKLERQQLEATANYRTAELEQKKAYYDAVLNKSSKDATLSQKVSAVRAQLSILDDDYKKEQAVNQSYKLATEGGKDKDGNIIIPFIKGSPDYNTHNELFNQSNTRLEDIRKKIQGLGIYVNQLESGVDIPKDNNDNVPYRNGQDNNNNDTQRLGGGLLPLPNGTYGDSQQNNSETYQRTPEEIQKSNTIGVGVPDSEQIRTADAQRVTPQQWGQKPDNNIPVRKAEVVSEDFVGTPSPFITNGEFVGPPKPVYRDESTARSYWSQLDQQVKTNKGAFDTQKANQLYGEMSPDAQKRIDESRQNIHGSFARSYVDLKTRFDQSFTKDPSVKQEADAAELATEKHASPYRKLGGDPSDFQSISSQIDDEYYRIQNKDTEFKKIGVGAKLDDTTDYNQVKKAYIQTALDKFITDKFSGDNKEAGKPTKGVTLSAIELEQKRQKEARALEPSGGFVDIVYNKDQSDKTEASTREMGNLTNSFNSLFMNKGTQVNGQPTVWYNDKFIKWMNDYKEPKDFGINANPVMPINPWDDSGGSYDVNYREVARKDALKERNRIINDPKAAFAFWALKSDPNKAKTAKITGF